MATFTGNIQTGNGYKFQTVEVCGITSYSTAVQVLEARYPGAKITAVRMTSNRDWVIFKITHLQMSPIV